MSTILDGKLLADKICNNLKSRVTSLHDHGVQPKLLIITASKDPASKVYVRNKIKRAKEIGIECLHYTTDNLTIKDMESVQHMDCPTIVQMPFTSDELCVGNLGQYITAENDVDGFVNLQNVAKLAMGETPYNCPCTPLGIIRLLHEYMIPISGMNVVMIGRSNIVGRPLAQMLEHENATVSVLHSKTIPMAKYQLLRAADIIISATGCPNTIDYKFMKDCCYGEESDQHEFNKVFVDIGMNRNELGKLCGDIPQEVKENGIAYTPVPGGIGPMTVAMLMENVVEVYERRSI